MNPCCTAAYYSNNKKIKNPFCPMCGNPIFIQQAIADGEQIDFRYIIHDVRTGEPVHNCIVLRPEIDVGAIEALNAYADTLKKKTQHSANLVPITLSELKQMDGQRIRVEQIGILPQDNWSGCGKFDLKTGGIFCEDGKWRRCHTELMDWLAKRTWKEIRAYKIEEG